MSDRDDALRRDLGWTGPEETDYEPPVAEPKFTPVAPPVPSRPPVDYQPADPTPPSPPPLPQPPPDPPSAPEQGPAREADRQAGATRPVTPPRFGPPPGTPRDTGPVGGLLRPDNPQQQWGQQPPRPPQHQPPPRPPRPPGPPSPGQLPYGNWPGTYGPDARMAQPAPGGSYADRIRADELVPSRRVPPGTGWRKALFRASFGLINLGPSAEELRQAELEARIKAVLRGHYKVGVMGKGGVGKTTVSASIGSVFAELRQDDRVVAIDADTAFGKLGSRVDPKAMGSYWELAADQHLETFADVRSRVGNNAAGLFVLAGEASPARRRVLDPAIYREATARLDRYFTISIVDCSSTMDTPVTQEVLRDLDALGRRLVAVGRRCGGGRADDGLAGQPRPDGLLRRTVVVLNDSDGHADKRTRAHPRAAVRRPGPGGRRGSVRPHLRPGGVIDGHALRCRRPRRGASSSRSPPRWRSTSRPTTNAAADRR